MYGVIALYGSSTHLVMVWRLRLLAYYASSYTKKWEGGSGAEERKGQSNLVHPAFVAPVVGDSSSHKLPSKIAGLISPTGSRVPRRGAGRPVARCTELNSGSAASRTAAMHPGQDTSSDDITGSGGMAIRMVKRGKRGGKTGEDRVKQESSGVKELNEK
jgi:hypothetical protein